MTSEKEIDYGKICASPNVRIGDSVIVTLPSGREMPMVVTRVGWDHGQRVIEAKYRTKRRHAAGRFEG